MSILTNLFGQTRWKVKLEEPSQEDGTSEHLIILGRLATSNSVKKKLMQMKLKDGTQRYYKQDVNPPYLHYIKKLPMSEE